MGTFITIAVVLAVNAALGVLLYRHLSRMVAVGLENAKKTVLDEVLKHVNTSSEALVAEVQGIVNAMAKDAEEKMEELASQQSEAIRKVIAGQDAVNKDYKTNIEGLLKVVGYHSNILKFETDGFTGGEMIAMQQHELSDADNPVAKRV